MVYPAKAHGPRLIIQEYFVKGPPGALLVTGQTSRKKTQNINRAMLILHETIRKHALNSFTNVPSLQQQQKVQGLIQIARKARRQEKNAQKSKKDFRRGAYD